MQERPKAAKRVVTFGEIMLRLSPPGLERLFQSPVLAATFGGGEANVAVSLAHFGLDSRYVTRVPANAVGEAAVKALRAEGVNVDGVLRGGERLGVYFAETGASQRAGDVIYDRARSAISEAQPGTFDWHPQMLGALVAIMLLTVTASVAVAKLAQTVGQIVFVIVGLAIVLDDTPMPEATRYGLLAGLAGFSALVFGLIFVQRRGMFAPLWRLFERLGLPARAPAHSLSCTCSHLMFGT